MEIEKMDITKTCKFIMDNGNLLTIDKETNHYYISTSDHLISKMVVPTVDLFEFEDFDFEDDDGEIVVVMTAKECRTFMKPIILAGGSDNIENYMNSSVLDFIMMMKLNSVSIQTVGKKKPKK